MSLISIYFRLRKVERILIFFIIEKEKIILYSDIIISAMSKEGFDYT